MVVLVPQYPHLTAVLYQMERLEKMEQNRVHLKFLWEAPALARVFLHLLQVALLAQAT